MTYAIHMCYSKKQLFHQASEYGHPGANFEVPSVVLVSDDLYIMCVYVYLFLTED
jgi:hypothetical protein